MHTILDSTENVPDAVLTSILRAYSGNPKAQLTKRIVSPCSTSGVSENNSFYQAEISWVTSNPTVPTEATSWLIKRWTPGGLSLSELGWSKPIEALAWEHGILRPESLPLGVKTPIVGSMIVPDGMIAWVAMRDVSKELHEYDRSEPIPSERLVSRAKIILSGLARFHALWEQPDRQMLLRGMDWLLPFENYLWRNSGLYAAILGRKAERGYGQVARVEEADRLNLQSFLEWLEPAERSLLEVLLVDRSELVDRFVDIPNTLLHGDLDDRNIGLSWSSSGESELVLIDWEWMGSGPAAMDVAKVLIHSSMMGEPGNPCTETCWSEELPDFYYENYRMAGGRQLDHATWRHSYDLSLCAQALWTFPILMGNIIRTMRGEAPLPEIPGITKEGMQLRLASSMQSRKITADLILHAMQRCLL